MSATQLLAGRPLLQIEHLSKTFSGCVALDGLRLDIRRGEVLALVGQNGCGKSTFIKILSGFHHPDHGYEATFDGLPMRLGDPDSPHEYGIHFVHQDLGLLADLSATENLAIGPGFSTNSLGLVKWREQRQRTRRAIAALGYDFDVTVPVAELSPSQRVGVAIARAMANGDDKALSLLVLDEPTASLPQAEVDTLFSAVRRLRDSGTAVVFVSHRLDEVFAVADRVTVMRDGRVVDTRVVSDFHPQSLVEQILGRTADLHHTDDEIAAVNVSEQPLLRVKGLVGHRLAGIDFEARAGEVIGITGLTGSGREELAPLLFGAQHAVAGTIEVRGTIVHRMSPTKAKELGMALVPADRRNSAVLPDASVRENLSLADLAAFRKRFLVRRRRERREGTMWMEKLSVKPMRLEESILNLSGGNQQKVILARWLRRQPMVMVLDEPTQGVDVGTKPEIYELLREVASQGNTVIVCSTDSEEIVEVSNRAIVLAAGRIHAELAGASLTIDRLNHEIVAA